jgi:hypothetical protein
MYKPFDENRFKQSIKKLRKALGCCPRSLMNNMLVLHNPTRKQREFLEYLAEEGVIRLNIDDLGQFKGVFYEIQRLDPDLLDITLQHLDELKKSAELLRPILTAKTGPDWAWEKTVFRTLPPESEGDIERYIQALKELKADGIIDFIDCRTSKTGYFEVYPRATIPNRVQPPTSLSVEIDGILCLDRLWQSPSHPSRSPG